jgi:hypothetical protein
MATDAQNAKIVVQKKKSSNINCHAEDCHIIKIGILESGCATLWSIWILNKSASA